MITFILEKPKTFQVKKEKKIPKKNYKLKINSIEWKLKVKICF